MRFYRFCRNARTKLDKVYQIFQFGITTVVRVKLTQCLTLLLSFTDFTALSKYFFFHIFVICTFGRVDAVPGENFTLFSSAGSCYSISKTMLFPSRRVFHTLNQKEVLLLLLILFVPFRSSSFVSQGYRMAPFNLKVFAKFCLCSNCSQKLDECSLFWCSQFFATARVLGFSLKFLAV